MKTYKNYLFDLYGTLADIHTNEDSPAFWRNVSRLLGMQGVDWAPVELKEKYKAEHKAELNQFYAANRLLTKYCPDGKYNSKAIQARYAELERQHDADCAAFKDFREETQMLWKIKSHINAAPKDREKENTHTHEQSI